jgi:choline-glycine betaine transporter
MASISTEGLSADSSSPPVFIKVVWGITIGIVGWIMVSYAGVNGVKMLSNIGGFPALLLMVVLCLATLILLFRHVFLRQQ